jgi:hypothetical protein
LATRDATQRPTPAHLLQAALSLTVTADHTVVQQFGQGPCGAEARCFLLVILLTLPCFSARAQDLRLHRDQAQQMLRQVSQDVEKNFYDPSLHGLDWQRLTAQASKDLALSLARQSASRPAPPGSGPDR